MALLPTMGPKVPYVPISVGLRIYLEKRNLNIKGKKSNAKKRR